MRRESFEQSLPQFRNFLVARGAQILVPTNEWELLRFDCAASISIVYATAKGNTTFTGSANAAWDSYKSRGKPWTAGVRTKKIKLSPMVQTLISRDGDHCFYCHLAMISEDRSVEHLVAAVHGGPNHISNFVLAHALCNARAGHLSAMEKIRIREDSRIAIGAL